MAVLLDTGVLYACYDRRDFWHSACRRLIADEVATTLDREDRAAVVAHNQDGEL